jgi:flagellar basal-body rod protein FlgC
MTPRPLRELLGPLRVPARGMSTQQRFVEVIARNLANAETTRMPEGGPYRREIATASGESPAGDAVVAASKDTSPGRMEYDPGHPDANADGFVEYPNVDVNTELVDLMLARRIHEANATVFQAAKSMLRRALDI